MYIKGIFIILACLGLGILGSHFIGGFLPGSVVGMLLLFFALMLKIVKPEDVRPVADFLTKNMTLFFLPAAIGIMEQWGLLRLNLLAWAVIVSLSTVCVLLSVCLTQDGMMALMNRLKRRVKDDE